jgi:hypothetical protein
MFEQNKYTKWYYAIITKAKQRLNLTIFEKHHIIPKSLKGSNSSDNIVKLTYREHYICHLLLTKMTIGTDRKKMLYALTAMKMKTLRIINFNSHLFDKLKTKANINRSSLMKGRIFTQKHKYNIIKSHSSRKGKLNTFYGKFHTFESKNKIRNRNYSNQSGDKHHNAKKINVNGIIFNTIKQAISTLKVSERYIFNILKKRKPLTTKIWEAYYVFPE